jgi:septin 7
MYFQILADIAYHNIHIFQAPAYENEDEESMAEMEEIVSKIPFAVVGSDQLVKAPDGREVRGRAYPWGVVEVDNEDHCDFVKLRQMLIRTYMEELREHTNNVLYENWRSEKLLGMGIAQDSSVFKEVKYDTFYSMIISHGSSIHSALPLACRKSVSCMRLSLPRWKPR